MPETRSNLDQVDGTTAAGEAECVVDAEASVDQFVDVGRTIRQGGLWTIVAYSFSKVSGFASSIVLARLLLPEHYGLIGMVNTVLAMVQIMGVLGIGAAIINARDDVDEYANTGWWMDVLCGITLFAIANMIAPLASAYYKQDSIKILILVASLNFLINPLASTMDALLSKELKFKTTTKISLANGMLVSILTIAFASMGAGVWSFVLPHVFAGLTTVCLRWRNSSFRPRLSVKWSYAKPIWKFGRNILGSNIFDYINRNVDYILVGGLMGERQLGLYLFAYQLGTWVVANVASTLVSLLFPTISFVRKDPERARGIFLKMICIIAAVGLPIVALQWATAPLFIEAVYGAKWLPTVTAFRLIALYGIGRAICAPTLTLISAMGRPDICFKMNAAVSPILVVAIVLGSKHGINGVALATALAHGVFVWLFLVIPFRILGWPVRDAVCAVMPAVFSSLIAAVCCAAAYRFVSLPGNQLVVLGQLLVIGFAIYVLANVLLYRRNSAELLRLARLTLCEAKVR